jgi:hypothetical protein
MTSSIADDGQALHELLFEGGDLDRPRRWCAAPTEWLVRQIVDAIEHRLASAAGAMTIKILDYGTGTGLSLLELRRSMAESGLDRRLSHGGHQVELHAADIEGPWFDKGVELLGDDPRVRVHRLNDAAGSFRPLTELAGERAFDIVVASMVLHLIPARAIPRLADGLARVLPPAGVLIWNSPDLAPARPGSVLFHDVNRILRRAWLTGPSLETFPPAVRDRVRRALDLRSSVNDARADRRILREPNTAARWSTALAGCFAGSIHTSVVPMSDQELLDVLLVPANGREFLPEVSDPDLRSLVIQSLMGPALRTVRGDGDSEIDIGITWTFGRFERRQSTPVKPGPLSSRSAGL